MSNEKQLADELLRTLRSMGGTHFRHATSGLMQGEKGLLFCLYKHSDMEEITPSFLSQRLEVKRPAVTIMLNSLEEKGYVSRIRKQNAADKRKICILLTPKGKEFVERIFQSVEDAMLYLVRTMGNQDVEELIRLTKRVIKIMEDYDGPSRQGV